jgi:hypothetical protein
VILGQDKMKNRIRKILKEEVGDFEWAKEIDPLQNFERYFYGNYKMNSSRIKQGHPGKYIKRDIGWWKNWIRDVEYAHVGFLEEIEDLKDMVHNLVNPQSGIEIYSDLAGDVYSYLSPTSALGGKSIFQDYAGTISSAYDMLGAFAEDNNLTILEVLDVFEQWLDKREREGNPLHKES